jgi:site-specific DNA-cytosine methylase
VPQRRKRIYLVADFTGRRAGEILFKPDSLRGDLQTGDEAGQEVTANALGGTDGGVGSAGVVSKCIDTTYPDPSKNQGGVAIVQPVIALQANGIDRADTAGCNGCGWRENESYTLLTGDHQNRITDYTAVAVQSSNSIETYHCNALEEGATTLKARDWKDPQCVSYPSVGTLRKYIIRRLTPTECARLQGFPDNWGQLAPYNPADAEFWEDVRKTHAEINGKKYKPVKDIKKWYDKLHTDSAEYKMWGNGIALPNAEFVMNGITEQGAKTLGSLFDGSGGFPLAGVMNGIKPLWASEVEPYPIAVTKSRFEGVTMW